MQISRRLGRTPDAVIARRRSREVPTRRSRPWSPADETLLKAGTAAGLSAGVLAVRLGRSTEQVRARRRKLLGSAPPGRPYLPHESEAIGLCLSGSGDLIELADVLGRSTDSLRPHAQHIGLYHPRPRRRFSEWEDDVIGDGYTSALPNTEIARQLRDRSPGSVAARRGGSG